MTQLTKMRLEDRVADVHPDEVENFKAAGFVVDDDGGDDVDLDDVETVTGDGTGETLPEESNLNSDVDLPDAGDESSEVGTSEVVDEQAEQSGESSESLTDDQLVDLLVKYFRDTGLESKPGVGDTETATGLDVNGKLITRAWKIYTAEAAE